MTEEQALAWLKETCRLRNVAVNVRLYGEGVMVDVYRHHEPCSCGKSSVCVSIAASGYTSNGSLAEAVEQARNIFEENSAESRAHVAVEELESIPR